MTLRRLVAGLALSCSFLVIGAAPSVASGAAPVTQLVASESYYRLDVPNATMSVSVDATIQNPQVKDLSTVYLWAMPSAQDIKVSRDDAPLEVTTAPGGSYPYSPVKVTVALPRPLKTKAKVDLKLSYNVPSLSNKYMHMEPGVLELMFAGQGPGSFVYVDVPSAAENYFDPGCLKAADQPPDVKTAGFERWICGDAALIAINTDNPSVINKCANADDKCRQRINASPYSAFVQSITDETKRGTLEDLVQLANGPVKLTLRFFRQDQAWADKQFAVAKAALPKLEELFGFQYPRGQILMRQSHHIDMIGAAGVAFPDDGEVLLMTETGFDEEVTLHELAHQWAGYNLQNPWLWEGQAEWAVRVLGPSLGIKPIDRRWESRGYKDPLATWYDGSEVYDSDYWYGKAGAFWGAYQAAVGGPENMTRVLSLTSPLEDRAPFDGRWFMDTGERISGANLDALFLTWVYSDTATQLLADRRAAYDLVRALRARGGELGVSDGIPVDIQKSLDAWTFAGVEAQVNQANGILESYGVVLKLASDAGLPPTEGIAAAWGTQTLAQVRGAVEDQRQAVRAITDASARLASEPDDSAALRQLAEAREKYAAGDFDAAERLAAGSATTAFNEVAATKMIALAKERKAAYNPSMLNRIGLLFSNPDGDLARAQQAYDAGDAAKSLKLSRSAYDSWNDASKRGLQRLAFLAGAMAALTVLVWYVLRRLDRPAAPILVRRRTGSGHNLGERDPRHPGWRDWENTPDSRR